jgi:GNAT superfamily N-acetyltransferase
VPAILLARLAVDQEHQGAGLGRSLLQDVLLRCVEAAEAIGARVLLVHAKHEAAKAWYMQYSFEESPTDPLQLLMLLKDVRAFLERLGIK